MPGIIRRNYLEKPLNEHALFLCEAKCRMETNHFKITCTVIVSKAVDEASAPLPSRGLREIPRNSPELCSSQGRDNSSDQELCFPLLLQFQRERLETHPSHFIEVPGAQSFHSENC